MGKYPKGGKEAAKTPKQLMREQMDELLGKNRDTDPGSSRSSFDDPKVDRFFLCCCSPYMLLKGTKSEAMPQLDQRGFLLEHSETLRSKLLSLPQVEKDHFGYEHELLELLHALVEEQDRRITRSKSRYDEANHLPHEIPPDVRRQIASLTEQIEELHAKSEALGELGDVDESVAAFNKANGLQQQLLAIEARSQPLAKKQYVDPVSGLVYSSTDSQARIDDLHSGRHFKAWEAIRQRLAELRAQNPPRGGNKRPRSS